MSPQAAVNKMAVKVINRSSSKAMEVAVAILQSLLCVFVYCLPKHVAIEITKKPHRTSRREKKSLSRFFSG
jgi:hypothetical protein